MKRIAVLLAVVLLCTCPNFSYSADNVFGKSLAPLITKISPAVVDVFTATTKTEAAPAGSPNQAPLKTQYDMAGSAVILDAKNGYAITNDHVVHQDKDSTIDDQFVILDRQEFKFTVVLEDPLTDLAIIKIDFAGEVPKSIAQLSLADSDKVLVGDWVIALGNTLGVGKTITVGIISGLEKQMQGHAEMREELLQHSALINHGNSGGALVDMNGKLVGINQSIIADDDNQTTSIGFAVPSNVVKYVWEQFKKTGKVVHSSFKMEYHVDTDQHLYGARVIITAPNGPAAKAGIKSNDLILGVGTTKGNEKQIFYPADLTDAIVNVAPGQTVWLVIYRDGKQFDLPVVLGEYDADFVKALGSDNRP